MFNLTPAEEERTQRLMKEAVVIDSTGGYSEPTEEYKELADELITTNTDFLTIYEQLGQLDFEHPMESGPAWKKAHRISGVSAISFTVGSLRKEMFSYEAAVKDLAAWNYKFNIIPELINVSKAADIERAKKEGKLGMILNFQNTTHIGAEVDKIDFFYQLVIRQIRGHIMTSTWSALAALILDQEVSWIQALLVCVKSLR